MDIFYIGEWLYKAPFKSFIPHVLNLIQMGENHKFFSLVINFVQMFEPRVVQQKKKKSFLLFHSGENFSTFPRMSPPEKVSQGCGVNSQLSLYNRGKGDVDHRLNYVVFLICSYYWISIEIFMVIVDKAATIYGSDTRSSREETSAWSQEWCTCKVFLLNTPLPHFPWCTLFAPQILHDLCFLFPWVLQESCNDMSENQRSLGPFKLNPQ